MTLITPVFGVGDASFQAAGGEPGIERLVTAFYRNLEQLDSAGCVRRLYPRDLDDSRQRLAAFLCGWLGGPRRYAERFGNIHIPRFHTQWPIGELERDVWLDCMARAIAEQPYTAEFAHYLLMQLRVPADRIVLACQSRCPHHSPV